MTKQRNDWTFFVAALVVVLTVLAIGYVVGQSTHLAPYRIVANKQVQTFVSGTQVKATTSYLRLTGDDSVYLVPASQLTPSFTPSSLSSKSLVTLTIIPESTGTVDVKVSSSVELKGPAYQVAALTVSTGKASATYTTQQYANSPHGYQHDQAALGSQIMGAAVIALAVIGLILLLFLFGLLVAALSEGFDLSLRVLSPWEVATGLLSGAIFLTVNFPVGVVALGKALNIVPLQELGSTERIAILSDLGSSPLQRALTFEGLWLKFLIVLAAYLVALAILSIRHLRLDLFVSGVGFLAIGIGSLHLLTWLLFLLWGLLMIVGVILGAILGFLGIVIGWLVQAVGFIAGIIIGFILAVLGDLIGLILQLGLWIGLVVLAGAGVVYLAVRYREELLEFLRAAVRRIWVVAVGIVLVVVVAEVFQLALPLLRTLLEFLGSVWAAIVRFLAPVFAFLARISGLLVRLVVAVLIGLLVGWVVYGIGAFILDQVKAGWSAGNGRRGVMLGSLAVGISVALILMETGLYGWVTYYPPAFASLVAANLHQASPVLDLLFAGVVLIISIMGLLRNVPKLLTEPSVEEFQSAVVMAGFGIMLSIVFIIAAQHYAADASDISSTSS